MPLPKKAATRGALIAGAVASLVGALLLWAGRGPLGDRLPPRSVGVVGRAGIVAGIRYVRQRPVLLSTALAFAGGSIFGVMANVALPLYYHSKVIFLQTQKAFKMFSGVYSYNCFKPRARGTNETSKGVFVFTKDLFE